MPPPTTRSNPTCTGTSQANPWCAKGAKGVGDARTGERPSRRLSALWVLIGTVVTTTPCILFAHTDTPASLPNSLYLSSKPAFFGSGVTANPSAPPTRAAATTQSPPASPVTSHGDTGLAASNSYRYRVRAVDAALNLGSYSAMASATAPSAPPPGSHDLYFNSSEPGCDGSDPTMLMCDDFEDGAWYYYSGGQNDYAAVNKGWKGESPTGPDPLGQNYGRCLPTSQGGAVGTNCSAESRNSNDGSGNQARHQLAPSATLYDDIYVRFYLFMPTGYDPYHHKLLSIGWGDALQGEQHLIVDLRAFAGPIKVPGCLMVGTLWPDREPNNTCWLDQNQGNDLVLTTNRWYYLEFHLKLNTAGQSNGVYEMWADDCGPDGLGCTGPGTLRTRFTGGAGLREAGQIKTILFEAWQNPNFSGSRYWDQVIVRTTRIGPMSMGSDATAPTVPDGLSASAVSSSQINLFWTASTDNVGVAGYRVERCLGAACTTFAPIGAPTTTNAYSDAGLTASTTYGYRVRANDAAGNSSGYSATASASTQSVGGGGLTDSLIHPPPATGPYAYNTFKPGSAGFPAVGGFYADPVFGTPVRRLTDVVGALNCDDIYAHHWANADGTYAFNRVLASGYCENPRIISAATGAVVYSDQPSGLFGGDIYWDANDPDKYYYFSGSSLMRRNLAAQTSTTIKIFPAALQTVGQSLNIQDRTGRYFTVRYGGTNKLWDSQTNSIYAGSVTPRDAGGWTSITPDGKYLVDASAEYYSYPIDHVTQSIGPGTMFWSLCGDHGALVSASDGKSYLVTFNCYDVAGVYRVDLTLNQAGRTAAQQAADNVKLIPLDWNDAGHFSAVSKGSRSDWVFMSTESVIDFFDSSTSNWTAYKQEILVVNVVTLQVRRLAHHRSRSITVDYQTMPRVSTSWDGSLVMWVSNFDSSSPTGYADLYAILSPLGDAPADTQGPSPPTNLAATAVSSTGIDLTWTASADNVGVTGYRVERCTGAACTIFAQIGAPTSASYSETGLTASTAYRYQVRATDAAGNLSGYSSIASATTPAPPDTTAPVLASVFASSITQTGATVTWTTDEPATTQVDYGLTSSYGSQTSLLSTLLTSHGASLSGLSAGTTYHYRVRSADGAGNLALSGDFALETLIPPDTTAPSAVSNLATVNPTTNAVTVTWTAPGDDGSTGTATAYEIRYSTSPITAGNFTSATNVTTPPSPKPAGGSESMTIGSLQSATTYYVALRTRDEVPNISALSNVATATTQTVIVPDTTPPTISNIAASAITTNAATVTWTTNEPATAEVRYGLTSTSLNRTVSVRTLQIAQSVALTGLSRNTRYYYQCRSKDAVGNERVAPTRSFTTLQRLPKLAKVNNLGATVGSVDASSQSRAAQSRQTSIIISGKANPVIAPWAPRSISSGRKSPRLPAQGTSAGLAAQAAEPPRLHAGHGDADPEDQRAADRSPVEGSQAASEASALRANQARDPPIS